MFGTVLAWFSLGRWVVQIIAIIGGAAPNVEAANVAQWAVIGVNILFIALLGAWTLWFAYVAHSREMEVSYETRNF